MCFVRGEISDTENSQTYPYLKLSKIKVKIYLNCSQQERWGFTLGEPFFYFSSRSPLPSPCCPSSTTMWVTSYHSIEIIMIAHQTSMGTLGGWKNRAWGGGTEWPKIAQKLRSICFQAFLGAFLPQVQGVPVNPRVQRVQNMYDKGGQGVKNAWLWQLSISSPL